MAKAFRDILSQVGYSTKRADNPQVVRERIDNPPGVAASSITSDGVGGPSTLFQDDHGPIVQKLTPPIKDNIATRGTIEIPR